MFFRSLNASLLFIYVHTYAHARILIKFFVLFTLNAQSTSLRRIYSAKTRAAMSALFFSFLYNTCALFTWTFVSFRLELQSWANFARISWCKIHYVQNP